VRRRVGGGYPLEPSSNCIQTRRSVIGWNVTEWNENYPRLHHLTVADLLKGKGVAYPAWNTDSTYKSTLVVRPQDDEAVQPPLWPPDGGAGSTATAGR
jgi:hypothetical protein